MAGRFEESEYVFCDLQVIFRWLRVEDEVLARRFLESTYDCFEFLAENPLVGRPRPEFGHEDLRSWRVNGFRNHLIFYRPLPGGVQIWRVLHGSRDLHQHIK
jgi:toxin ParE1/3/4